MLPWSECIIRPLEDFLHWIAIRSALWTSLLLLLLLMDQPTTCLEYKSSTTAKYSQPSRVPIKVVSETQALSGSSTSNCRWSKSGAGCIVFFESVVITNLRAILDFMSAFFIRRATRFSLHDTPSATKSAWILGEPYIALEDSCDFFICSVSSLFSRLLWLSGLSSQS